MNKYKYAEYAVNGIKNRNQVKNVDNFTLETNLIDCYQSIFIYTEEFQSYVTKNKSVRDFNGKHIAKGLFFDFDDKANPEHAKQEVVNFIEHLHCKFDLPHNYVRIYFSGLKGFHIQIPFAAITNNLEPSKDFWFNYKSIALELAEGFMIDKAIYERRRLIRLTNTIHSESGLYKIPLTLDEIRRCSVDEIKKLAIEPREVETLPEDEMVPINSLMELFHKHEKVKPNSAIVLNSFGTDKDSFNLLNGVNEGNRHNHLVKIVSKLIIRGHQNNEILQICTDWNKKNNPPFTDKEINNETNNLIKRFRTNNDGLFIDFPVCLLSLEGGNEDKLKKIACYVVKNKLMDPKRIEDLHLTNVMEEYFFECDSQIKIFKEYGPLIYTSVGVNFLLETINGKVKYEVFSIYAGIFSYLGKTLKAPKLIATDIIRYRSCGFRNLLEYQKFCNTYYVVELPTEYRAKKSIDILSSKHKNMLRIASLKKGRIKWFSTYYKTDQEVLNFLVKREKKKIEKIALQKEMQMSALKEIDDYKSQVL